MRILTNNEIQQAIRRCKPSKVAVAYIGTDWKRYIQKPDRLTAIIVSPTLGSNPRAIADLATCIGWEKIFFLNELHTKAYIGEKAAVIGSANLTRNGLDREGLVELCVEVNAGESLRRLNQTFNNLKKRADKQYPTTESKMVKLEKLEKTWGAAIANHIISRDNESSVRPFLDFELLGNDHFYVLWYQLYDFKHSDDVKLIEHLIVYELLFDRSDNVEMNKRALVWRITDSSKPHRTAKPYWMYIHEVFENGVIDRYYPKCAIQRSDLEIPSPPFEITDDVSRAFKKVIQEKEIAEYLIQDDREVFSLADSLNGIPLLVKRMKEQLAG